MPNNPTELIPLVQKAYGQPMTIKFDKFKEGLDEATDKKEAKKNEDGDRLKSLYEIGADLTGKGWSIWSKNIDQMMEGLESGEMEHGSTDWVTAMEKMTQEAKTIKEGQVLLSDLQKNIQKNPETYQFMQDNPYLEGEKYNSGLDGLRNVMLDADKSDYVNGFDYAARLGQIGSNLRVDPYSQSDYNKMIREAANNYGKGIMSGATSEAVQKNIGGGMQQVTTTTTAPKENVDMAVGSLRSDFDPYWKQQYSNMVANKMIDSKETTLDQFATSKAAGNYEMQKQESSNYKIPTSSGSGKTETPPTINSKEVAFDVSRMQDTDDASHIEKYITGNKHKAEIKNGKLLIWQDEDLKDGEKKKNQYEISLGDTAAIFDAISNINKGVSRKGLVDEEIPVKRTQAEREADAKKDREIRTQAIKDRENIFLNEASTGKLSQSMRDELNDLDGVEYLDSFGDHEVKITIGKETKTYELPEDKAKVLKLLKEEKTWLPKQPEKAQSTETVKPSNPSGIGSKYNTK